MNFLAHIFLSGDDQLLMVGNFIADFVKGNRKDLYPEQIRKGIELHRKIDAFTDQHPYTLRSRDRLRSSQRKYAGVVVDILYDHFLARNFHDYSAASLRQYSLETYRILHVHEEWLPAGVLNFLPFMIEKNWLLNYASLEGLDRALTGLSRRVSFENRMNTAIQDIKAHYSELEKDFNLFFPELRIFVKHQL